MVFNRHTPNASPRLLTCPAIGQADKQKRPLRKKKDRRLVETRPICEFFSGFFLYPLVDRTMFREEPAPDLQKDVGASPRPQRSDKRAFAQTHDGAEKD